MLKVWYNDYSKNKEEIKMLIAIIILSWVLLNTWIGLIYAEIDGTFFAGWSDLGWLFLFAIFGVFELIFAVLTRKIFSKKS